MVTQQYTNEFYIKRQQLTRLSAKVILGELFPSIQPSTVIDFGCATGIWLAECKRRGVKEVKGLDGAWVDEVLLEITTKEFLVHDLGAEKYVSEKKYDLALCIEVAEHLSPEAGDGLVGAITGASDVVLFSAAICGQGGTGHVNEQPQQYWVEKFALKGFVCVDLIRPAIWEDNRVNVIYKQNLLLYVREEICGELNLEDSVISSSFYFDRVHPDLFYKRVGKPKLNIYRKILKGLTLILKRLGLK